MVQRFLPGRSRGGAGHFAHGLARALVERGHAVTMVSEDPPPDDARYESVRVPVPAAGWRRRLAPLSFPFRVARLDFSRFDLIHAHGDDQLIRRRRAPPVVRTLHGSAWLEAVHNGWRRRSPKLFGLHLYFYAGELVADLRADQVVAVSRDTGRYYPRLDGVVPNGIDIERFAPRGGAKSERPTILFVGEAASRKRGDLLLRVVRESVRPGLPDLRVWMVSPDRVEEEGVEWFDRIDDDRLADLYRAAWILCLPSSYEGFGRPYAEALAAGTPVVASPNPGAREVLEDGRYGVIARDDDLGGALLSLLRDGPRRADLARRGLERARAFSWERVAARYERIYDAALARRRAS